MPRLHVDRSIQIDASAEQVYQKLADFSNWTTWSPWLCAEPDAQVQVSSDPASVGSVYQWKGQIVGQGEIEHRHLDPPRRIEDQLRFIKPFRSRADVAFQLEPSGPQTMVTWQMRGALPWFMFWMRAQMEALVGMDYDRGLKMLKQWIETGQIHSKTIVHGPEPVGPLTMAGVRRRSQLRDIGPSMQAALDEARQLLASHQLPDAGQVISVYHRFDLKSQTFEYTCGMILPEPPDRLPPELDSWSLPASQALRTEHIGSYQHLGNAWSAANQVARYRKLKQSKAGPFEIYRNDPRQVAPADLRTDIYLPLRS